MKLTTLQALEMLNGLNQLESPKVLKLSAGTRWKLTRNLRKLSPIGEDFETSKKKCIEQLKPDAVDGNRPGYEKYMAELLQQEIEVPLQEIGLVELDLEKNDVPVTTLARLGEMVKE